jgi:mannobiose 2-epimerase
VAVCAAAAGAAPAESPSAVAYRRVAREADANLRQHVITKWFPAAVDFRLGGFHENFAEDWTRSEDRERNLVYQARMTWLAAQMAGQQPPEDAAKAHRSNALWGIHYLTDTLWDQEHGGFHWAVDSFNRRATHDRGGEKHVYGIAFGIYAAASTHALAHDDASLELAKRAFRWLDEHAHDNRHGGYFEALDGVTGRPVLVAPAGRATDAIGTAYGRKSMNTHIHLLEAFVALHAVWPDPAVRDRLAEVHELIVAKLFHEPGALHMYVTPDWQPAPGRDSYGHDVEAAYLLTDAAEALGKPDDERTWHVARRLVDHALDVGFDRERGGFYNEGTIDGRGERDERKIWWVQAEGLNTLLLMHERFGRETPRYWDAFLRQWAFISAHQVDKVHGGWFPTVNVDGTSVPGQPKSDRWTEGYHQGRALLNVSARLNRMAKALDAK